MQPVVKGGATLQLLPRLTVRLHLQSVLRHHDCPTSPGNRRKVDRRATGCRQELWRVGLYMAMFTLLSSYTQPWAVDALGRQLNGLPVLIGAITPEAASCVVLWALADEFKQQFDPVIPAPREKFQPTPG